MSKQNTRDRASRSRQKIADTRRAKLSKELAAAQKSRQHEEDKRLRAVLRKAKKYNIYNAESTAKLTKHRRTVARQIERDYQNVLSSLDVKFVKAPKKAREKAKGMGMKTSKTGIFVVKGQYKRTRLLYDKTNQEYYIRRYGKTKKGPNAGRTYTTDTPLTDLDTIDEVDRLEEMGRRIGPLKGKERLFFSVYENGVEGLSKVTFSNVKDLIRHVEKYPKKESERIKFMRLIKVHKVKSDEKYKELYDASHPPDVDIHGKPRTRRISTIRDKYLRAKGRI